MPLPTQWVTLPAFGASAYMPSIVLERALFVRERNDGLYRVITYLIAKMIDELVLAVVGTLGVSLFVWFGVGLVGSFVNFWLVYFVTLCNGIILAYLVAAIAPNMVGEALRSLLAIRIHGVGDCLEGKRKRRMPC